MAKQSLKSRWKNLPEAVRFGVSVYAITRLIFSAIAFLVMWFFPLHPDYPQLEVNNWVERWFIAPWYRWDADWFLKIVTEGYGVPDGRSSFYPLYPGLTRLVGDILGGHYLWSGLIVSNVALIIALILLFKLVERHYSPNLARGTVICLALYPAYFFNLAYYAESLSLLFTVACFYVLEDKKWRWVGVFASLAVLSKLPAVVLLVPISWEVWQQRKSFDMWKVVSILAIPLTILGWVVTVRFIGSEAPIANTDTPFGLLTPILTPAWQKTFGQTIVFPSYAIYLAFQDIAIANKLEGIFKITGLFKIYYDLIMVFFFALFIPFTRRLRYNTYVIYCVALFVMNLMLVIPSTRLANFPRRMMMAFPVFIVLAMLGRKRWIRIPLLIGGMTLSIVVSVFFVWWRWVG